MLQPQQPLDNPSEPLVSSAEKSPRAYTDEEMVEIILDHVVSLVFYWNDIPRPQIELLRGLAFSMLVMIDGGVANIPSLRLSPLPHKSDRPYAIENDEDYWPEDQPDLAGALHEQFVSHFNKILEARQREKDKGG